MSGKILIVDELATNRIVLKVKLSATPYEVVQAASADDALRLAASERPDLILSSTRLSGQDVGSFISALRRIDGAAATPILMLQTGTSAEDRADALRAGVDDILSRPVSESLLLARLRNLLRQRHTDPELAIHHAPIDSHGPGFADAQAGFAPPGRIAIIAASRADAINMRGTLAAHGPHAFEALTIEDRTPRRPADIYMLRINLSQAEDGLRLLADLKAARPTRDSPVIALLDAEASPLAVTLLDMGADDVITGPPDPREVLLRIDNHLGRKRRNEGLRAHLLSGLQAACLDPLTGVYNRRHALPFLQNQLALAQGTGGDVAVMLVDFDFFKRINDTHGHAAGDAVLRSISTCLRRNLRETDMLARIGGEEFLVVLPDTPRERAQDVAQRLCDMVRETGVTVPGIAAPLRITISIGVTIAGPTPGTPAPTVEDLLDEADRALYLAKAQGRNQASFCARSAA
ncbi:diguanylate cyclase [Roseovarius sp. D22-M7]|uniref:diguanylate cyclase n=1 Tax=Roseovarius sp. D22-M7 TaxID=3127116 RepID=UPI00301056E9